MKIYTFAPLEKNIETIDPKYFGMHGYTKNDSIASDIKRTFWYVDLKDKEYLISGNLYATNVNADLLYDLRKEKNVKNILAHLKNKTIDGMLHLIKKMGYFGVIYKTSDMNIVNLFRPIKAKKVS